MLVFNILHRVVVLFDLACVFVTVLRDAFHLGEELFFMGSFDVVFALYLFNLGHEVADFGIQESRLRLLV